MLQFDIFNATRSMSFETSMFLNLMLETNNSRYVNGYHGYSHMLRTINTFDYLIGDQSKSAEWSNTMVSTLIWHDCNYSNPDDDHENTELAIASLDTALKNSNNFYSINMDNVKYYIKNLCYPYNSPAYDTSIEINDNIKLLRDCDTSMILYEDYFVEGGLFLKLLYNEFKEYSEKQLKDKCYKYIMELSYYDEKLNKILEDIGRNTLWKKCEEIIKYN